ncbi:MAG TPA: M1 family metallopeptidase [Candidatus Saccharimonadales bacterium]|nr:M1 family metallopeptidase [Candidatus Saccharimonadales bacterium]
MSKSVKRLYEQFQPEHYDLQLKLDPDAMTFGGSVIIHGKKVGRPSQRITLHQKGLTVTSTTIRRTDKKGDTMFAVERINAHDGYDEVRLHSSEMLYPGDYHVMVEFSGKLTSGMTGIYPCFYTHEGAEKKLIATQFESHHAREAFPCIDEPEAKATFSLVVEAPDAGIILSNTPAVRHETDDGSHRQRTEFAETPRMSTYLLAFVYGELQSKSAKTQRGTEVSVWSTVAQPLEALDFAVDIAKRSIEFFEDYFNVPYPLPKSDHVALPDFSSGAMENWGLITYRERVLLAYPGESSQSVREQIALVIAHETSHQWFGNLVTMKWWDDLWLNESFADMMEYQAVDTMFPDWHVWDTFVNHDGLSALRRDSIYGVQAVKTAVHHPDEINTLFDPSIVYAKGGRLLTMLKNYIGEEAFRQGLSAYFTKHTYGNTEGTDLWAALSEASGHDIGAFMNPWLQQSGFPVVSVHQEADSVRLSQEHFLDDRAKIDSTRRWPVPLFSSSDSLPTLLEESSLTCQLPDNTFVYINRGALGHYIVNYDTAEHRAALLGLIQAGELANVERLMLLNDASMLARANYQHYGDVLRLLEAYESETSEPVWDMMALIVGETKRFIDLDEKIEDAIKRLVRKLITHEYERLGWEEKPDEPASDQKLRATIIALGAYGEHSAIIKKAIELFESYKKDQAAIPAELRSIVFGVSVKEGTAGAFDYLVKLHDSTSNSDLKGDVSAALTITRSADEAQQLLGRLKDAKLIKPQDMDRWLVYLLRNRYVRDVAWSWMTDNWSWIEETFKNDKSYDYFPRYAASMCNTKEWADKYKAFFEPKLGQVVLKRNIEVGLEEITNRVTWLERDLPSVQQFFKASK